MRDRLASLLKQRGYGAQADLARALGEHRNRINNWVRGYADIPIDDVPRIAAALGVTICDLYGVKESHQGGRTPSPTLGFHGRRQTEVVARMLAEALDRNPERIVIHVYDTAPSPAPSTEGQSTSQRFMRDMMRSWSQMDPAEKAEWRSLASEIRLADEAEQTTGQ